MLTFCPCYVCLKALMVSRLLTGPARCGPKLLAGVNFFPCLSALTSASGPDTIERAEQPDGAFSTSWFAKERNVNHVPQRMSSRLSYI